MLIFFLVSFFFVDSYDLSLFQNVRQTLIWSLCPKYILPYSLDTSSCSWIQTYLYFLRSLFCFVASNITALRYDSVAESICTHYSNLSGRPDIFLGSGTFKKSQGPCFFQKAGCKRTGLCYSKIEETRLSLLFFNNNFQKTGCLIFFQSHKPTLV